MKVICIKSCEPQFTINKVYPIVRIEEDYINVYTESSIKKYVLRNNANNLSSWSDGPGNGTTQIHFKEHFIGVEELRENKLKELGI